MDSFTDGFAAVSIIRPVATPCRRAPGGMLDAGTRQKETASVHHELEVEGREGGGHLRFVMDFFVCKNLCFLSERY